MIPPLLNIKRPIKRLIDKPGHVAFLFHTGLSVNIGFVKAARPSQRNRGSDRIGSVSRQRPFQFLDALSGWYLTRFNFDGLSNTLGLLLTALVPINNDNNDVLFY